VGEREKTARVRAFDLGGRELALDFSWRDPVAGRSAAAGLAVDEDRTIFVADTPRIACGASRSSAAGGRHRRHDGGKRGGDRSCPVS
jgi:hypothetical protein